MLVLFIHEFLIDLLIFFYAVNEDQHTATDEKTILEEAQRAAARDRKATGCEYQPKYFEQDGSTYLYKHSDSRYVNKQLKLGKFMKKGFFFSFKWEKYLVNFSYYQCFQKQMQKIIEEWEGEAF